MFRLEAGRRPIGMILKRHCARGRNRGSFPRKEVQHSRRRDGAHPRECTSSIPQRIRRARSSPLHLLPGRAGAILPGGRSACSNAHHAATQARRERAGRVPAESGASCAPLSDGAAATGLGLSGALTSANRSELRGLPPPVRPKAITWAAAVRPLHAIRRLSFVPSQRRPRQDSVVLSAPALATRWPAGTVREAVARNRSFLSTGAVSLS